MRTPEQLTKEIIAALDAERKTGFCDEYGIIADAVRTRDADWRAEIAIRDQELAMQRQVLDGRRKTRVSKEDREAIKKAVDEGVSYRRICRRFGFKSPSTIHRIVKPS